MSKSRVVRASVVLANVRVVKSSSADESSDSEKTDSPRDLRNSRYIYVTRTSKLHTIKAEVVSKFKVKLNPSLLFGKLLFGTLLFGTLWLGKTPWTSENIDTIAPPKEFEREDHQDCIGNAIGSHLKDHEDNPIDTLLSR